MALDRSRIHPYIRPSVAITFPLGVARPARRRARRVAAQQAHGASRRRVRATECPVCTPPPTYSCAAGPKLAWPRSPPTTCDGWDPPIGDLSTADDAFAIPPEATPAAPPSHVRKLFNVTPWTSMILAGSDHFLAGKSTIRPDGTPGDPETPGLARVFLFFSRDGGSGEERAYRRQRAPGT